MSYLKTHRNTVIYGVSVISLVAIGSSLYYYITKDDNRIKRRKQGKLAANNILHILDQIISKEVVYFETKIKQVESSTNSCDDKDFKLLEMTLVELNQELLKLINKLESIRPLTLVLNGNTEVQPTDFERQLASTVKSKKQSVIESVQQLFCLLELADEKLKQESERRRALKHEKHLKKRQINRKNNLEEKKNIEE